MPYPTLQIELEEIYPQPGGRDKPPGPEARIRRVKIVGAQNMPVSEPEKIVADIENRRFDLESVDRLNGEIEERIRDFWQDAGYFRVLVQGSIREVNGNSAVETFDSVIQMRAINIGSGAWNSVLLTRNSSPNLPIVSLRER